AAVNKPRVNFLEGTVIIAVSIGLAWVLSTYIEKPLRSRSGVFLDKTVSKLRVTTIFTPTLWVNQLAYVLVILLVIGAPVLSVRAWAQQRDITVIQNTEELVKNDEATYPGARAVGTDQMSRVSKPIPQDIPIYGMLADWGEGCPAPFTPVHESLNTSCAVKQNGDDSAPLNIIVGSSHALQMTAAFEPIAQRTGTNQMNLLETGCPYPFAAPEGYLNDRKKRCIAFSQKATEEILRLKPTTVVIIATTTDTSADAETADPDLDETLRVFTDAGIQVIGLRDNPRFAQDMYVCAIRAQGDKSSCSEPIEQKYGDNPAAPIFEKYADRGAYLLDLKDIYCPDGLCRSVIGNVYVYADTNHLTKAFEHTLAETIYERALAAGWKPEGRSGS
ncbi:MAG: SGNH hydrolase domain-containing protein, partial [Rothia dentocariosa]